MRAMAEVRLLRAAAEVRETQRRAAEQAAAAATSSLMAASADRREKARSLDDRYAGWLGEAARPRLELSALALWASAAHSAKEDLLRAGEAEAVAKEAKSLQDAAFAKAQARADAVAAVLRRKTKAVRRAQEEAALSEGADRAARGRATP